MYEANPMAMLIEQAGGKAVAGKSDGGGEKRIMAVSPHDIHQRCPVVLGSPAEVDHVLRHL
jgi:fructose-1,6-bisphosphatase I